MTAPRRYRVWLALVGAPVLLAGAFLILAGVLITGYGWRQEVLLDAMVDLAPFPTVVGFAAGLGLTLLLARRDGFTVARLGWGRPRAADVMVGLGAAVPVIALDAWLLHPLISAAEPSFDPALPGVGLGVAALTLTMAVVAEDSLYRGYALLAVKDRHGTGLALLVTSVAYAFLTPSGGVALRLWAAGFGLFLSLLRLWKGSLWTVASAHLAVALTPKLFESI